MMKIKNIKFPIKKLKSFALRRLRQNDAGYKKICKYFANNGCFDEVICYSVLKFN